MQNREAQVDAYNEDYWVRLSGTKTENNSPLIQIVGITNPSYRGSVELPLSHHIIEFDAACIVQNLMFYGKTEILGLRSSNNEPPFKATIGIFDLMSGVVVAEYSTKGAHIKRESITATEHFVAWSEPLNGNKEEVKYLNLNSQIITTATIASNVDRNAFQLHLSESHLTITYSQGPIDSRGNFRREVIDLITGEKLHDIKYKRETFGKCSFDDGILLISDLSLANSKMYIESFKQDYNVDEKSQYRE